MGASITNHKSKLDYKLKEDVKFIIKEHKK
jgi:hypothetical protein